MQSKEKDCRIELLANALGINLDSLYSLLELCLCEQLIKDMVSMIGNDLDFFKCKDSLRNFREKLEVRTNRIWCHDDLLVIYNAVKETIYGTIREPISYSDYLNLLWKSKLECAKCHKKPPVVKLHIDHIRPVSLRGKSTPKNLRFLCEEHNLEKSNKLEGGSSWLSLK